MRRTLIVVFFFFLGFFSLYLILNLPSNLGISFLNLSPKSQSWCELGANCPHYILAQISIAICALLPSFFSAIASYFIAKKRRSVLQWIVFAAACIPIQCGLFIASVAIFSFAIR